jgi:hypothetical protein
MKPEAVGAFAVAAIERGELRRGITGDRNYGDRNYGDRNYVESLLDGHKTCTWSARAAGASFGTGADRAGIAPMRLGNTGEPTLHAIW